MAWFLMALQKYAQFTGRSRRKEYWMFTLFVAVIGIVLGAVDALIGLRTAGGIGLLGGLFSLATLVPGIAVSVRRMHDTGRSGLWLLVVLVPVVGWLAFVYFAVQDSEPGDNRYGPNPKGAGAYAFA